VTPKSDIRAEAEALQAVFAAAGAVPVDAPDAAAPTRSWTSTARTSARAPTPPTTRPGRDDAAPRLHRAGGADACRAWAEPARYTYLGEVFRKQPVGRGRPVGIPAGGLRAVRRADPAKADAEVFALFSEALRGLGLRAVTGDMGILLAAIEGLSTTAPRKAALRRHVWRPRRFRALLDRFTGACRHRRIGRACWLAWREGLDAVIDAAGDRACARAPRSPARIADAAADAETPPIAGAEADVLGAICLKADPARCLRTPARHDVDMPGLAPAVDRFAARMDALRDAGLDPTALPFEASYGRTTMEYYDGFVFGFLAPRRPDLPPVATGGRYDALTRRSRAGADPGGGRRDPARNWCWPARGGPP
jgi:ATP phosphoribosyltransferase regulatory subunit